MPAMQTTEDILSSLLENLNPAQREAVAAPLGNTLVLAGAGSGKTRVLIHRIAWLIEAERIPPYSILAVTFTNKAATEMRSRLQQLLQVSMRGLWVGTFHGLAHRLLRAHHQDAGLPENFQILDSDDQQRTVRRVIRAMELDDKQWPPKQAQSFINARKEEGVRPDKLVVAASLYERTMAEVYRQYEEVCRRGGLVDFAELLLRSLELWQKNPPILEHYRQRFRYLLVDEFQDTNTIQYQWLSLLAGKNIPMFAVGDDDQSIYGWRGAKVENLHRFQRDFAPTQMVRLEQNYRSTGTILEAANTLISNNQGRLGKNLWTEGNQGEPIGVYQGYNEVDEARFVVERVRDWVGKGGKYSDCGVLYRSNAQSRVLEEELMKASIPYQVYGGLRFFERAEIKDALAYLRLMANHDDDAAFERVVNMPPRGIGDRTVEDIRMAARQAGASLWQAASRMIVAKALSSRAGNAVRGFMELIIRMQADTQEQPLHQVVDQVVNASQLINHYKQSKIDKGEMRVENLEELANAAREFEFDGEMSPLNSFLSYTALDSGDAQTAPESVQLMTLHSAKGLEFPLVFLCGLEEDLFPHRMALQDNGLEEERRLCYVGVTRAMRQLYLSYAEVRRLHGNENYTSPSRFLAEIPQELVQEVRFRTSNARQPLFTPPASPTSRAAPHSFRLGQNVVHEKFGEGVVLEIEGSGESERVHVNFRKGGSKWLIVAFARLQGM
jgi:DNA helicase-2/ATP-dependent DNA helicase PcrA